MRGLLMMCLLAFGVCALANEQNYIEVQGKASLLVKPDYVQLSIGVDTRAKKPAQAAKLNAQSVATLVDFLKSQGIKDKDLSSEQLSLNAQIDYQNNRITGYQATRTLQVWVRDFSMFDKLLVDLAELGGNRMNNLQFGLDDKNQWQTELQEQAMENAINKALILSSAGDVPLGVPIRITEMHHNTSPQPQVMSRRLALSDSAESVRPSLQTKGITLNYSVLVRFALY